MNKEDKNLWYKDAIIYEVPIKSFFDSNKDGVGDINGLTSQIDYIADLGVTAIWILPFYVSPLKDDGYDIGDYYKINPQYGNLKDFKNLIKKAHEKGLKVITELVINHTSIEHSWFQRARRSPPGSSFRDFYVWSESPQKYSETRIIFKDFENSNWTYDSVADAYYWHRFYFHQPDLNFDNEEVQKEIFKILDFWLNMGVDGLRLDAIPYLYERENTNCENLPETHQFLKKLRAYVDKNYVGKMLLAEANQWPIDSVSYFGEGSGDECHMAFHFPLMPRMFMAIQLKESYPIIDILNETPDIPSKCQWAMFLRNHDELTLEMVTDEERDYMYKSYAKDNRSKINLGIRRRLAPLLNNDRRKIELMNILLLTLPGTPVLYYGDEIGMGDNIYLGDRDGVRTPMQWKPDRNAGFSNGNPQQLYLPVVIDPEYHYETINVENQEHNFSSLLWWMKRILSLRKQHVAFGRGTYKPILNNNSHILSFARTFEDQKYLVVVNLSDYTQTTNIDSSEFLNFKVQEILSDHVFPAVSGPQYFLSLGPYNYFIFKLDPVSVEKGEGTNIPIESEENFEKFFRGNAKSSTRTRILKRFFSNYTPTKERFKNISSATLKDLIPLVKEADYELYFMLLSIEKNQGRSELFMFPVCVSLNIDESVIFSYTNEKSGQTKYVLGGYENKIIATNLTMHLNSKIKPKGANGQVVFYFSKKLVPMLKELDKTMPTNLGYIDNKSYFFNWVQNFTLKQYLLIEPDSLIDLEMANFLSKKHHQGLVRRPIGNIQYEDVNGTKLTLGLFWEDPSIGVNGWDLVTKAMERFFFFLIEEKELVASTPNLKDLILVHDPGFLELIKNISEKLFNLHEALGESTENNDFKPEPFNLLYQRGIYQWLLTHIKKTMDQVTKKSQYINNDLSQLAKDLSANFPEVLNYLKHLYNDKIKIDRQRIHGDLHLGQFLFTGKDFLIHNFEGDLTNPLSNRKVKQTPLRDIAGLIRSFHYAAYHTIFEMGHFRKEEQDLLSKFIAPYYHFCKDSILETYFKGDQNFDQKYMVNLFLLYRIFFEWGKECETRPNYTEIPMVALKELLFEIGSK